MNGETLQAKVVIANPQGFHMRPMAAFARRAAAYDGTVVLLKEDRRLNGKSMMELLSAASEQGTELTIEVRGPDPQPTLDELVVILSAPSMDDDLPPKG